MQPQIFKTHTVGRVGHHRVGPEYMRDIEAKAEVMKKACEPRPICKQMKIRWKR